MQKNPFRYKCSFIPGLVFLIILSAACNMPAKMFQSSTGTVVPGSNPLANDSNQPDLQTPIVLDLAKNQTPTSSPPSSFPPFTPTVTHNVHPGLPPYRTSYLLDSDSSITAPFNRPKDGDNFDINLYERPFNAGLQDIYYPSIDIIQSAVSVGNTWIYVTITLKGPVLTTDKGLNAYAIELDLDLDGRGDYLIVANSPNPNNWSTDGIQIWHDANHDVGGSMPIKSDPPQNGNGYEELVYDQGKGVDPDLAWARISPNNPDEVWFAFKTSVVQGNQTFLWGAWAQSGGLHPAWFDYNDHYTFEQAGSPLPESKKYYPLKGLAGVDNTCRWAVGFSPSGDEPGVCPVSDTPTSPASTALPVPKGTQSTPSPSP